MLTCMTLPMLCPGLHPLVMDLKNVCKRVSDLKRVSFYYFSRYSNSTGFEQMLGYQVMRLQKVHFMKPCQEGEAGGEGGGYVACLNFKMSCQCFMCCINASRCCRKLS